MPKLTLKKKKDIPSITLSKRTMPKMNIKQKKVNPYKAIKFSGIA